MLTEDTEKSCGDRNLVDNEVAFGELLLLLARGEQEIREGTGFELDDVLAEADTLLAGNRNGPLR